jgi:hypothetical protein
MLSFCGRMCREWSVLTGRVRVSISERDRTGVRDVRDHVLRYPRVTEAPCTVPAKRAAARDGPSSPSLIADRLTDEQRCRTPATPEMRHRVPRCSDSSAAPGLVPPLAAPRLLRSQDCGTAVGRQSHLCAVASGLLSALHAPMPTQANVLETHMYIGGGILGTILVLALIFYVLRRA